MSPVLRLVVAWCRLYIFLCPCSLAGTSTHRLGEHSASRAVTHAGGTRGTSRLRSPVMIGRHQPAPGLALEYQVDNGTVGRIGKLDAVGCALDQLEAIDEALQVVDHLGMMHRDLR